MTALCEPWVTTADVLGCPDCVETSLPDASAAQIVLSIATASEILHGLSGREMSACPVTVYPCCAHCLPTNRQFTSRDLWNAYYPSAFVIDGAWYNVGPYSMDRPCVPYECGKRIHRVDLGVTNVVEVTAVTIAGEVLDADAYRLDGGRWLVRVDGEAWPVAQDLGDFDAGWSVSMTVGVAPTPLAKFAAAELACQLLLRLNNDDRCLLPDRTVRVNRQGVNFMLDSIIDIVRKGGIGLYTCDMFVKIANPEGLAQRPRVVLPRRQGPYRP